MGNVGFSESWTGPRDYFCVDCHLGFMEDEIVYLDQFDLAHHKQCMDPIDFRNMHRQGCTVIGRAWREANNWKPFPKGFLDG